MSDTRIADDGLVQGLHHVTLVTSNQEVNRRFYTDVLGLRRVKLTVNQDDIFHRHLFYANEKAETGSAITFFEWPDLPKGRVGLTSPHHLSYAVANVDALPKWRSWLLSYGVSVVGPLAREGRISLYLKDPDGVTVEITKTNEDGITSDYLRELSNEILAVPEITSDMKLISFDHASPVTLNSDVTVRFLGKLLGLKNSFIRRNPDQHDTAIVGIGNQEQPDFLRYIASPNAPLGHGGRGGVHHIAMAVDDEDAQQSILRKLNSLGASNSGVIDRFCSNLSTSAIRMETCSKSLLKLLATAQTNLRIGWGHDWCSCRGLSLGGRKLKGCSANLTREMHAAGHPRTQ